MRSLRAIGSALAGIAIALVVAGCATPAAPDPDAHMAAFSAKLTGGNQVPPVVTVATGQLYAALDRNTLLLRWKLAFSGLSGPVTKVHFHGPVTLGPNANSTLSIDGPLVKSPVEGRATLTVAQAMELLSGRWYVSLQTKAHAKGEIRGQLIVHE